MMESIKTNHCVIRWPSENYHHHSLQFPEINVYLPDSAHAQMSHPLASFLKPFSHFMLQATLLHFFESVSIKPYQYPYSLYSFGI